MEGKYDMAIKCGPEGMAAAVLGDIVMMDSPVLTREGDRMRIKDVGQWECIMQDNTHRVICFEVLSEDEDFSYLQIRGAQHTPIEIV
jgi:hypothetical protein